MRNALTPNNRPADSSQAVSISLYSPLLRGVFLLSLSAMACADANMPQERTLMLAAASTIDALEAAVKDFESKTGIGVDVSFGPTSTIARQIEQGAPADLLLSANGSWADYVDDRLAVARRVTLVSNQLIVVKPVTNQLKNETVPSLREFFSDPQLRFAIADPNSVPAGIYARQALEASGFWESIEPQLVPTVDVRAALALVSRDEVDGGFVYATDVARNSDVTYVGPIDPMLHDVIEYPLLLLDETGEEAAELFKFLISDRGRKHFLDRGFTDPYR